jgi:hypothetical protein
LHIANKVRLSGFILVTGTQDTKIYLLSLGLGASFQWQAHFTTANIQKMDKIMETVVRNVIFLYEYEVGPPFACNTAGAILYYSS